MRSICQGVIVVVVAICIPILYHVLLNQNNDKSWILHLVGLKTLQNDSLLNEEMPYPVIVWPQPMSCLKKLDWRSGEVRKCGQATCYITTDLRFRKHPNLKGYLFFGYSLNWTELPLPREGSTVFWGLIHDETPRSNILLTHPSIISLFNLTATFSRHSDLPTTTQFLPDLQSLSDMKYFETVEAKNSYQKNASWLLAPVVYIQTDCSTPTDRDAYVAELSKFIRVDSYGLCLHNRNLPPHLQYPFIITSMMSDDLLYIVGKYKFALAIENAVCKDYITEKLWRPLITGTVPIYLGSPTVTDWLPNNRSAILGLDFKSPKHLAEYLHFLDSHDEEYNSYLDHKLRSTVTNSGLLHEVKTRNYAPERGQNDNIEKFECSMCDKIHNRVSDKISIATSEHYSCELPASFLTGQSNMSNTWTNRWSLEHCKAKVIRKFIDSGVEYFTEEEIDNALSIMLNQNKC